MHFSIGCKISFKYTTKGPNRAMVAVKYDKVEKYENLRSIGASEVCWRFFKYDTQQYPAVQALRVHLDGESYVVLKWIRKKR